MERIRKPCEGVVNILRFNWHFYLLAVIGILLLYLSLYFTAHQFRFYVYILLAIVSGTTLISLLVSFYVYDLSGLYNLNWLNELTIPVGSQLINIHAGFDETSALLQAKYPRSSLKVLDFYNPAKHTEVSIKRARNAYPPYNNTVTVSTSQLPLPNNSVDAIFVIFAAHEIRDEKERVLFFKELNRALKDSGKIIITEHLRDFQNFLAYNIGFFHFYPHSLWQNTFFQTGFKLSKRIKSTPFVTTFIIEKNGNPS